jgi:Zn-dependent peptidase ImmA (M78 family)/transcriptional regulator with XRE-family HTH domain
MIGQRLRAARRAAGMSQEELGAAIGVSKMAVSKYETGAVVPASARLVALAEALGVPVSWILEPAPPTAVRPLAARTHPLSGELSARASSALIGQVAAWLERYRAAEGAAGSASRLDPPLGSLRVASLGDVEAAAGRVRELWGLGSGPIHSVAEALEDHGLPVMLVEAPPSIDALAVVGDDGRGAVVVGRQPGDRQRFSLAHELAHLLLAPAQGLEEEDAAHRFAAAFLVPAEAARTELGARRHALSVDELRGLKRKYGFSMQAWVRRARELGIVPRRAAQELLSQMRAWGWEAAEPAEGVAPEVPSRLERLVLRALVEGGVTESRAAELLAAPLGSLREHLRTA